MIVRMAAVCSIDGKITRGANVDTASWASPEDQTHFRSLVASHDVVVMGRKTYEASRRLIERNPGKRRVILTRHPEKFASEVIPVEREFSAESPQALVQRLQRDGIESLLVVGGGEINGLFLASPLVDELYLTIEPDIFGKGTGLVNNQPLLVPLQLISLKRLNSQGSILLHYGRR